MWDETRSLVSGALQDVRNNFRSLAITDLAFKMIAVALLTPGTTWLLYWIRSGTSYRSMADADILRFFVTTRAGVATLLLGGSLIFAITALETACLMAIGHAAADGKRLSARSALLFAGARAPNVLRLTANMVVRLIGGVLPFLIAGGAVYLTLLRKHDINYYLAQKPPVFWLAAGLVGLIAAGLVVVLVWTIARWALSLPLVLFEGVSPRVALGESAKRSAGLRWLVVMVLTVWAAVALALASVAASLPEFLGRSLAPGFDGSLAALLGFISVLALVWAVVALAAGVVNIALFALLLTRLYLRIGRSEAPRHPLPWAERDDSGTMRLSGRARLGVAAFALLAAGGFALLAFFATRTNQPVLVIAHRGASIEAPENTLAAFRLAAEQGTDFVELDVQESSDGVVVVVHDSDLMKAGGAPMKIWETDAATLRTVDIGSRAGPQFAGERVPTLAEALAACKGKCRVVVELKSYGHNQRLEERVVEVVEAAGMANDCIFMSLDHGMMRKLKQLRPAWRCGILVAKAFGDLTELKADFLAVEARMATRRFVRRAHGAGQQVYIWTVDDPAWMLAAMGRGVDGLITNKPDLARQVVARRAGMSDAQRLLVALLVRMGARTQALEAENALRP